MLDRATDEREHDPDQRVDKPDEALTERQAGQRRIDKPVEDDDDREELVQDEIDPRDRDLQIGSREQQHDHDEGDRQVDDGRAAEQVDGR